VPTGTWLRRRQRPRDEWIRASVAERLRLATLAAYQRLFGLELKQLVHLLSRLAPGIEPACGSK
jgi:hypothetical protein